ncbi:MAG: hypothetical protein IIC92_09805, partial [Chloroflexi bacterium]|nr:hypothetical protein [Chloroflexota bacterium]
MTSERMQRRVERLLDQADEASDALDWERVESIARSVLSLDASNTDAQEFLALAAPHVGEVADRSPSVVSPVSSDELSSDAATPTSFANDRYQVSKFLGEGGKKRVYQAHDTLLDRDVAFALIKTEGFDQTSRERISREAQAMGRLGTH